MSCTRRALLAALGAAVSPSPALARRPACELMATWRDADGHRLGRLRQDGGALRVVASVDLPTRAHGLVRHPRGGVLVAARRPGDWLLHWDPDTGTQRWVWASPGLSFNGHLCTSADARLVFTTGTDAETGEGHLQVWDAASLEPLALWPTGGADPHDLRLDTQGRLFVANGGIATRPETGRQKIDIGKMDSSLVCLDGVTGATCGVWRVPDVRLSLRHLAWARGPRGPVLGIAIQAEHDDPAERVGAPVLALFDGTTLRTVEPPRPMAGYGGDIAALGSAFAVSCPRSDGIALCDATGHWLQWQSCLSACALATDAKRSMLVAGGSRHALLLDRAEAERLFIPEVELDNHWLLWQPSAAAQAFASSVKVLRNLATFGPATAMQ